MTTKIQTRMIDYDWANVMDTDNIAAMFPVGHLLITTNVANPATYGYRGVWELLPDNANLRTAKVTSPTMGKPAGSDTVSVPLPAHTHGATGVSSKVTVKSIVPVIVPFQRSYNDDYPWGASNHTMRVPEQVDMNRNSMVKAPYSSPTEVNMTPRVNISNTGTPNASLNVAGRTIDVLVWQRIA